MTNMFVGSGRLDNGEEKMSTICNQCRRPWTEHDPAPPSIASAVVDYLREQPDLTALVGDRIYSRDRLVCPEPDDERR